MSAHAAGSTCFYCAIRISCGQKITDFLVNFRVFLEVFVWHK